jgi:hypothetical protein
MEVDMEGRSPTAKTVRQQGAGEQIAGAAKLGHTHESHPVIIHSAQNI